jgi:hypothetical protein
MRPITATICLVPRETPSTIPPIAGRLVDSLGLLRGGARGVESVDGARRRQPQAESLSHAT